MAKINDIILKENNRSTKTEGYINHWRTILRQLKLGQRRAQDDVLIGRYLMTTNDPDLYQLPKSKIEKLFKTPKDPSEKKQSPRERIAELETRLADLEQSSEKRIAELETRVQKLEAAEEAAIFLYNLFSTNGDDTEVKSWLSNSGIPWTIYNHNK